MDCFVASLLAMTVLHLNRRGCLKIESEIGAHRASAIPVTSPRLRGEVEAEGFG
jgi:hypothetical protein